MQHEVPKSAYRIPLPPAYGPPVGKVMAPAASDKLRYGEYLANIGHCLDCHTPRDDKGMLTRAQWAPAVRRFPAREASASRPI